MSEQVAPRFRGGALFAVPYSWQRENESPVDAGVRNGILLDHLCEHPHWFATPLERHQIRESAAWMLTHPEYLKWEVWLGGRLVGMIMLSRIVPKVDALFHFALGGISMLSARALLWNALGYCFTALELQRVSFEIPEHIDPAFIRYMRGKLHFRYEGEVSLKNGPLGDYLTQHLKTKQAGRLHMPEAEPPLARLGSRREHAHWDPASGTWQDIILLRLLRSEYEAHCTPGVEAQATETSTEGTAPAQEPHVARIEAG